MSSAKDNNENMLPEGKGFIYNMVGVLARNKTTVYLITLLLTFAGYSIFNNLPKEQFPEIVVPQIFINTVYAGTAPADIENLINKPLEKQIKSEKGVKRIKSNALQDVSVIMAEFDTDVTVDQAKERVKSAIDRAKRDLPKDLTQDPIALEVNFSEFPIMNINLAGNYPLDRLKEYADKLKDDIESLSEITRVDIIGALDREIQIDLDLGKMNSYGISFYDIQSAVQGENVNISGGDLNVENVRRTLRVKGEFKSMDDIKKVVIRSGQGAIARLDEVAEVHDSHAEKQDFARLDGASVITLNVIKRGGENLIVASEKIEKILDTYKENKFPSGLKVRITADQSERTKSDLNDLINTVVLGFIFVVLILMFFMGVRDAIFVGLSVPLSALLALYPLMIMGFTLNTIVLFAFLLGLGIVVDDAIVVIENSHRLFNKFKQLSIVEAVKLAASEVFIPVFTGTLTTIAPFFPLLFWPGMVGEFMKYLPFTLIFTLFASLIVAYVMNPIFAISFMKREEHNVEQKPGWKEIVKPMIILAGISILFYVISLGQANGYRGIGNFMLVMLILYIFNHFILTPKIIIPFQSYLLPALKDKYRKLISWTLYGWRPLMVVVSMIVLLISTFVAMGIVKPKVIFFPSGEPDYIYIYNVMPVGTDAVKTDSVTWIIEGKVMKVLKENNSLQAVNSVISNVGKNAGDPMNPDRAATPHKSKVTVAFVSKQTRGNVSSQALIEKIRNEIKSIPGTEISVERENNGPPTGKAVAIELVGEDFVKLRELEGKVRAKIESSNIRGIDELKSDLVTNKPEIIINIDRNKSSREGISSAQIAMALRNALFGVEISKFRTNEDEYPIQLRLKPEDRGQIEKLLSMNISYRDMVMGGVLRNVPLTSLADISYSSTFSQINRKNAERTITLSSDVLPSFNPNEVNQEIYSTLSEIPLESGYQIKQGGEQEDQQESMQFLSMAFLISLLIIYLILATQFNSVIKPVIIFMTIILSLIGVLLGFMVFGKTFSIIMSGVGIIALAGIVVKNGILLIEFTDELLGRGYELKEAIIEAGATRLTPVLLTAAAAVLGLIPLAFGLTIDFAELFINLHPVIHTGGDSAVFWNILAWTIIFGLSFSTILTLCIVPCMYYINEKVKSKFKI